MWLFFLGSSYAKFVHQKLIIYTLDLYFPLVASLQVFSGSRDFFEAKNGWKKHPGGDGLHCGVGGVGTVDPN